MTLEETRADTDDPAVREAWDIIEELRRATKEYLDALDAAIASTKGENNA